MSKNIPPVTATGGCGRADINNRDVSPAKSKSLILRDLDLAGKTRFYGFPIFKQVADAFLVYRTGR